MTAELILVTGGSGQVGSELRRRSEAVFAPSRAEMDLADPASIAAMIASRPWSAVINAAAYTAVDRAEHDIATAWVVNAVAPAVIAAETARASIPLIHVSTDYVFDGGQAAPYLPDDETRPLGTYGASKLAGEIAVRAGNPQHAILRTAWVVSPYGSNFLKTMLRLGAERDALSVVADQHGCPTSAGDIADTVLAIAGRLGVSNAPAGTWHFVNAGEATWYDLAAFIFDAAAERGGTRPLLSAIRTSEYPTPARRPANSRLDTASLQHDFAIVPRHWQEAVREIIDVLMDQVTIGSTGASA